MQVAPKKNRVSIPQSNQTTKHGRLSITAPYCDGEHPVNFILNAERPSPEKQFGGGIGKTQSLAGQMKTVG